MFGHFVIERCFIGRKAASGPERSICANRSFGFRPVNRRFAKTPSVAVHQTYAIAVARTKHVIATAEPMAGLEKKNLSETTK